MAVNAAIIPGPVGSRMEAARFEPGDEMVRWWPENLRGERAKLIAWTGDFSQLFLKMKCEGVRRRAWYAAAEWERK